MWLKNCLNSFLVSSFHGTLPYFLSASFTLPKLSARSGMKAMKPVVLEWGGYDTSWVLAVTACSGKWCFGGALAVSLHTWKVRGRHILHCTPGQRCFGCILREREETSCVLMEREAAFCFGGWGGAGRGFPFTGSCSSTASPLTEASPQRPCPSGTRRGAQSPTPQKTPQGSPKKPPHSAHACLEHPRAPLRPAIELQFQGAPLKPPLHRRHPLRRPEQDGGASAAAAEPGGSQRPASPLARRRPGPQGAGIFS